MKRALTMLLLGMTLSVMVAGSALAEFVYVTKNGKKYHHSESRFIRNKENVEKLTIEEAKERGIEPARDYLKYKTEHASEKESSAKK